MPGGDRSGPLGKGPRTGRAVGFCAGFGIPGYNNSTFGQLSGGGRGRRGRFDSVGGNRWRNQFYATGHPRWMRRIGNHAQQNFPFTVQQANSTVELRYLKEQSQALIFELEAINSKISEIEKQK